jgi:hypothetical protein
MPKLNVVGVVQDFSAVGENIPDLYASANNNDYWLELKYEKFKLGHDKYDRFEYSTITRGQLEWLKQRQIHGHAFCGILGYMNTGGIADWVTFMTAEVYLQWIWRKEVTAGAVILTRYAMGADRIKTGADLLQFIQSAAGTPLSKRSVV